MCPSSDGRAPSDGRQRLLGMGEQMSKMLCAILLGVTLAAGSVHAEECVSAELEAARARIFEGGKPGRHS